MYLPIIGMEIHLELKTLSKMFCGCPALHFAKEPNTQVCPVCLGLPGALPVPNEQAIHWTVMIGHALGCRIAENSKFDRKHYFYPDLPKGYQISQYDEPLCLGGSLKIGSQTIGITRVHLEEDTGKLQHQLIDNHSVTLADFNRSGVALVEIVTDPDLHSAIEAKNYAQEIRKIINFLNVSDCDMEKGSMRLEANISLSQDITLPKYKVEVKNINSFNFLGKAIDYEINRQSSLLEKGFTPKQETRGFDEKLGVTVSQRSKEEAKDYRYFPEPDIPPIHLTKNVIKQILSNSPKLPGDYYKEFTEKLNLRPDYALSLTSYRRLAEKASALFTLAQEAGIDLNSAANFLINKKNLAANLTPKEIILELSQKQQDQNSATDYVKLAQKVIAKHPDIISKYREGKISVIGVLIGEAMKDAHGQANPTLIKSALEKYLAV